MFNMPLPTVLMRNASLIAVSGPHQLLIDEQPYCLTRYELGDGRRLFLFFDETGALLSFQQNAEHIATEVFRLLGKDLAPSHAVFAEVQRRPGHDSFLSWDVTWVDRKIVFVRPNPLPPRTTH